MRARDERASLGRVTGLTKEQQYAAAMDCYSTGLGYSQLGALVSAAVVGLQAASLAQVPWREVGPGSYVLAFVIAYLLADFINGFVHMVMDNTDRYQSAVGPLIAAFHLHHKTPRYKDSNPLTIYVLESGSKLWLVPYLGLVVYAQANWAIPAAASLVLAGIGVLSSVAEVSHYLCHNSTSRPVRLLQRLRLLLPPEHHAVHHRSDNTHYAFLNGVSDPILNVIARRTCQGYVNRSDRHAQSYEGPDTANRG